MGHRGYSELSEEIVRNANEENTHDTETFY